jgi:tripartite-type tricarboxylate transporter receptor subunit TctC
MSKVPYRNPVEAINDLATGRIHVNETAYAIARPQVDAGKVKLLAVTNGKRAPTLPDIPTVTEAGFTDLHLDGLVGFFGGPDMPLSLRERIAADVRAVGANDPLIVERMNLTGQLLDLAGPAEFQREIDDQRNRVAAAAKALGITPTQ